MLRKRSAIEDLEFPPTEKKFCNVTNWNYSVMDIDGLCYFPKFISQEEETKLMENLETCEWSTSLKRRVQHYGYRYDYKARTSKDTDKLGELPEWVAFVVERLQTIPHPSKSYNSLWENLPDQLIINEYEPGQGISAHIDNEKIFGDTIVSLSLASSIAMEFIPSPKLLKLNPDAKKTKICLERCSALVLCGEARTLWKHCIPARKQDKGILQLRPSNEADHAVRTTPIDVRRQKRISLTFRKMIIN